MIEADTATDRGQHRLVLSLAAAVVIGAVFLFLAVQTVSVDAVWTYLQQADWGRLGWAVGAFVGVYSVCHAARVLRWYYLVRPLGEPQAGLVHRICAVGFTAILIFPLRLGELVRPFLLARRTGLSAAGVMATVVVERVIDGLVVTGLLFLGLWTYQGEVSTRLVRTAGTVAAAIFAPAMVMCIVAYYSRRLARRVVMATLGRLHGGAGEWVAGILEQFATGFRAITRGGDLAPFLVGTAVYWTANVLSMWLLLRIGFGLQIGPWEMVTVMAVLVVGIMVPAGPAMAGNFEYFLVQGLGLYVDLEDGSVAGRAGVFAAVLHLLQIAVIVVPGAWIMARYRRLRVDQKTVDASQRLADGESLDGAPDAEEPETSN